MRFDTPVYFQRVISGDYDATTGDYGPDVVHETQVYASVTNTGTAKLNLVYGALKQDSLTVRLQNHYNMPYDRLRIGNALYNVDMSRKLRNKHTFIVSSNGGRMDTQTDTPIPTSILGQAILGAIVL